MPSHNTLLAVLLASAASFASTWAQPAAPSLADACQHYAAAMERVRDPRVPFPVVAGAVKRTEAQATICKMMSSPNAVSSSGDAAAVQDAANDAAVAAAPYAQQGARP